MAWTAELIGKEKEATHIDLIVRFTDGANTVTERFRIQGSLTVDGFRGRVRSKIAALNALPQTEIDIPLGSVDLTPPTPPPPPTAAEIAETQWQRKFERLQVAQHLVDHGVIPNTLPAYVNLRNEVQSEFLPAYFANL